MTKSHGISLKNVGVCYHVSRTATCIEIVICADGYGRIQLRGGKELENAQHKEIYGRQAFTKFKKLLEIKGIINKNEVKIKNRLHNLSKICFFLPSELILQCDLAYDV